MARYVRGIVALHQCDTGGAERELRLGLSIPFPGDYRYYWQHLALAQAEWWSGHSEAAFEQWQTYTALQPDPKVRETLAAARAGRLPRRCEGQVR